MGARPAGTCGEIREDLLRERKVCRRDKPWKGRVSLRRPLKGDMVRRRQGGSSPIHPKKAIPVGPSVLGAFVGEDYWKLQEDLAARVENPLWNHYYGNKGSARLHGIHMDQMEGFLLLKRFK